jgi:uncharacterized SAM-binding protein YcdF (DUF218 family)
MPNSEGEKPLGQTFTRNSRAPKTLRWLVRLFLIAAATLVLAFSFRARLARALAEAWIVNDSLQKADVIVVTGGALQTRPFEAARLYHEGFAPKILVMNPKPSANHDLGLRPTDAEITRQVLLKLQVPASNIVVCAETVISTRTECDAVLHWSKTNATRRIIIPLDMFHTRRARWIFRKILKSSHIDVKVEAIPDSRYSAADWWQHEETVVSFRTELIKYAYYRAKY